MTAERSSQMATFKKFEDIKAWQKARRLTGKIYNATGSKRFAEDFGLRNQIQRASVSIMANIAKGFGRHSDKEFANFLNIAHASVSEVQSHLYVALDLSYIEAEAFKEYYELLEEIGGMTFALGSHLRKSRDSI
jgi:four helix bundle protein